MEYRRAISCIITIFISISLSNATEIGFGAKGGLSFANMYGIDAAYVGNRIGFNVGAFTSIGLSNVFKIQSEVLYTQKGGRYVPPSPPPGVTILKLDYVEAPVLIKAVIPSHSGTNFSLFTGPFVAYNISARAVYDTFPEYDIDNANDFDYGLVFGAGLDFPLSRGKIVLDARYEIGFVLTFDTVHRHDRKNDGYSIMLGYAFR